MVLDRAPIGQNEIQPIQVAAKMLGYLTNYQGKGVSVRRLGRCPLLSESRSAYSCCLLKAMSINKLPFTSHAADFIMCTEMSRVCATKLELEAI